MDGQLGLVRQLGLAVLAVLSTRLELAAAAWLRGLRGDHARALFPIAAGLCGPFLGAAPLPFRMSAADIFYEGDGSHKLYVTIRPPEVIPGVADIQIRAAHDDLTELRIVPLPLSGDGAVFAPTPDQAARLADDPQTFTGHLWMMTAGSWQVRIFRASAAGVSWRCRCRRCRSTAGIRTALSVVLFVLLLILVGGCSSIIRRQQQGRRNCCRERR